MSHRCPGQCGDATGPFASYRDLKNNLEFYHDLDAGQLYLYCDYGIPDEVFESIEICDHLQHNYSGYCFWWGERACTTLGDAEGDTSDKYDGEALFLYNPETGKLVTVVVNVGLDDYTVTLDGLSGASARLVRSGEGENWAELGDVEIVGGVATVTFKAQTITTVVEQ